MNLRAMVKGDADNRRFSAAVFYFLAALLVFFSYLIVLALVSREGSWRDHAYGSLLNFVSLAIVAAPIHFAVVRHIAKWRSGAQLVAHLALAPLFSLVWYWLLRVFLGVWSGGSLMRFTVQPFFDVAGIWQLLQGLTLYALVAALACLRDKPLLPSFVVSPKTPTDSDRTPALSRYFIRQGEDIHPIDVAQIVSIAGADDYAEVATLNGRHLVRMRLNDFEKALGGGSFIRVHRSCIVNADQIVRAEPAGGGRVLLLMENGQMVQASRAGTKLLRDRVL